MIYVQSFPSSSMINALYRVVVYATHYIIDVNASDLMSLRFRIYNHSQVCTVHVDIILYE